MQFETFSIDGPTLIKPSRIRDARGWFMEAFRADEFEKACGEMRFVQHNHSMSYEIGTIRGLHFQVEPRAQGKLVRCLSGAIRDVAVDIRRSSPTFGQHISVELTEENGHQLWLPAGFAHGFVTQAKRTQVSYLVTDYYSREHDQGLLWNDSALSIDWGVGEVKAVLSDKDRNWPCLKELKSAFA